MNENVIEWFDGDKVITATFNQRKYVTKIKKLAENYPNEVRITDENLDGSIVAHIPLRYLKISRPPVRELTEDQKEATRERLEKARMTKNK